jgi:hypothetical protein
MSFLRQVTAATTVDEVVDASRDYIRVWSAVLHRLPDDCRPADPKDADDIVRAADSLKESRRRLVDSEGYIGPELDVTADFFSAAAARIDQLRRQV